jgi:hypothetical protein
MANLNDRLPDAELEDWLDEHGLGHDDQAVYRLEDPR